MTSYESLLGLVADLPSAASVSLRDIRWMTEARVVGVARSHEGRVEVFLSGAELAATSKTVRDGIKFRAWHRDNAPSLDANRLLLPAHDHFDQVTAFICTELLRNCGCGAQTGIRQNRANSRASPRAAAHVERGTHRTRRRGARTRCPVPPCRRRPSGTGRRVVERLEKSSRNFVLRTAGIEVKTTTRNISSHRVQGVHQVEPTTAQTEGGARCASTS